MDGDKALIADIQRLSTEDGPGNRTTVFFKGCNLSCTWCHNPECISFSKQIQWLESRCIGCKICIDTCPHGALKFTDKGIEIDRNKCVACAKCVAACPGTALECKGTVWELDALVEEVCKDKAYFGKDGGVTASGGEPLMQSAFLVKFLAALQSRKIHTAVDTAGLVSESVLLSTLPYMDLIMLDLKIIDSELHKRFTLVDNAQILSNAQLIAKYCVQHHKPVMWIRTPIIPGATDTDENINGIGRFVGQKLGNAVKKWELCAFNNLCRDKYRRLDMKWDFDAAELMTKAEMEHVFNVARESGANPDIITWSGTTRVDD
jgi:pyruvate formate lyase activating enzyme